MKKTFWLLSLVALVFIACSGTATDRQKNDLSDYFAPENNPACVELAAYPANQRNIMVYRMNATGDSIQVLDSMVQLDLPSKVNIVSSYFITDSAIYLVKSRSDLELVPEKKFQPVPVFKMPPEKGKKTWSYPGSAGKLTFTSEWASMTVDGIHVKAVKISRHRETVAGVTGVSYYAKGYGLVKFCNSDDQGNEDVYSKLEFKRFVNGKEK